MYSVHLRTIRSVHCCSKKTGGYLMCQKEAAATWLEPIIMDVLGGRELGISCYDISGH